jgi:hypothetical protein
MDRDDFIIAVFLVVCEQSQAIKKQYRFRRGGFAPDLTDEEVITMEIQVRTSNSDATKTFLLISIHIINISFQN